jgi:hypothetical protein
VATPFEGEPCDCHDLGGDGIVDLAMKFKTSDLVAALLLSELPAGATVELIVTGSLLDETSFEARDCITIVPGWPTVHRDTQTMAVSAESSSGRASRCPSR